MSDTPDTRDYAELSDEEFMSQAAAMEPDPAREPEPDQDDVGGFLEDRLSGPAGSETDEETPGKDPEDENSASDPEPETDGEQPAGEGAEGEDASGDEEDHTTPKHTTTEGEKPGADAEKDGSKGTETDGEKAAETPDYKALYKQIMGGFKANGKDFTPQSPDEAIQLMQMGANYTKKMQVLKPNLQLMRMLEKNGLLEEQKLSFLIDLDRKDPKAISKLLQDGKLDPMDLETSEDPGYKPGNYAVSDEEMSFHDVVETVGSTDTGAETLGLIKKQWDKASKEAAYREPNLIQIIHQQRENGIYDVITAEMDRWKILGELTNTPFIDAYKAVGDDLHKQGKLAPKTGSAGTQTPTSPQTEPKVVDTRPARKPATQTNGDQVKGMSKPPQTAPTQSRPANEFDPFTMSDEQIMAMTSLKV